MKIVVMKLLKESSFALLSIGITTEIKSKLLKKSVTNIIENKYLNIDTHKMENSL